jgi:phage shock protein E
MIRNYRFLVVLSLFMLVFSHAALAGGGDKDSGILGNVAAAEQAWQMIDEGALLIDVRSASEFASGTIDGSVNIPHTEIENLVKLIGDDLDRSVVVYCRSGNRSGRAQTALEKLGYTGVFNATGYEALVATRP